MNAMQSFVDIWDGGLYRYERWPDNTEQCWEVISRELSEDGFTEVLRKLPLWKTPGQVLHREQLPVMVHEQKDRFEVPGWEVLQENLTFEDTEDRMDETFAQNLRQQQPQPGQQRPQWQEQKHQKKQPMGDNRRAKNHHGGKNNRILDHHKQSLRVSQPLSPYPQVAPPLRVAQPPLRVAQPPLRVAQPPLRVAQPPLRVAPRPPPRPVQTLSSSTETMIS